MANSDNVLTFEICTDCTLWLANADASGLDYSFSPEEAEEKFEQIKEGERELQKIGHIGNIEADYCAFSTKPCECCGSMLAGSRGTVDVITE